jgi:hypothetical protein
VKDTSSAPQNLFAITHKNWCAEEQIFSTNVGSSWLSDVALMLILSSRVTLRGRRSSSQLDSSCSTVGTTVPSIVSNPNVPSCNGCVSCCQNVLRVASIHWPNAGIFRNELTRYLRVGIYYGHYRNQLILLVVFFFWIAYLADSSLTI